MQLFSTFFEKSLDNPIKMYYNVFIEEGVKKMCLEKISLKSARVNAGYTQKQVANKLKVAESTVVNWENGKSIINAKNLFKLSYLYNVKVDNFSLPYVCN